MDKRLFDKRCRYGIRKFTVGTASVLIGFSFLGAQQVSAEESASKPVETGSVNVDVGKLEDGMSKPASLQAGNLPKESLGETSTVAPAAELPKEGEDQPRMASGEERAGEKVEDVVSQPASAPTAEVASTETAQDGTEALEDHFTASQPVDKAKVDLAVKSPEYLEKNYAVFPKPRQFDYQEGVTRLDGRVDLVAAPNVDIYTLNRAKSILKDHQISYDRVATAQSGDQKLYLGIHGENSEAEKKQAQSGIAKDLYDKIDAYSLVVKDGEISIVGKDTDAVFYGLTTLKHLLNENPLPVLRNMTVQDYADVKNRGFIEGYYGNPWSNANRMELMRYGGGLKLTQYFFAPKDDPYHNSRWWELYPEEQLQGIRDLARTGNQTKTRYVWTMHPFMHRPVRFTDDKVYQEDLGKIQAKFTQLLNAGVREFGILADDARPPQGVGYAGYTRLMTDLSKWLESKKADYQGLKTDMIFVPSQYMDSGQSTELRALNKDLPETAHLVLTGGKVWGATENTFLQTLKKNLTADGSKYRPVQMWMNWPTTDGTKNHLILGDGEKYLYPGVDPTMIRGVMLNPMQQSEPSKIALFSVAQYTWHIWPSVQESRHTNEIAFNFAENGRFDDSKESAAFRELGKHMRNQNRPAYVTRLDESIELAPKLHAFMDKFKAGQDVSADREQLRAEFAKIKDAAVYYKAHGRKEMVNQIHYWLDNTVDQMEAVDHLLTATEKMSTTDRASLWQHYHQGVELYKQSKNHPFWYLDHYENAELGVQHIRPFILGLQDILAKAVEQDLHPDKVFTSFITNRKDPEGRLADVEDGDKQTHVIFKNPNSIAKGDYVGLEFNRATDLHQLTFVMGTNANIHDTFSKAELQYMDEAGQWQKLASKIVGNEETIHLDQLDIKAKGVRLIAIEPRTNVWLAVREIAINQPITNKPSPKEQVKIEISSNIIYKQNTTAAQMLDSNASTETMLSNADTSESKKNITPAQAWVRLDLGSEKDIQKIHLVQGAGDKLVKGLIEISMDDKTWTKVADLTGEQEKTVEDRHQARYVRVRNLEDLHKWWRIADFSVETQSGNLELNDSNVESLKSLPVVESLGCYELKIPAGTSLPAHAYLGMKLERLHELKNLSLVGEKNEALLLEYSPNGQEWYRENALSVQQRARYIRLSNPTDQAQNVKASSLVVETKEVLPPSLQSTTMDIDATYGANDVRKIKNLDQLFDGVYNNFVEFSDYAHKDGNIILNLGQERDIKKIRAYIQDGTRNYLRDGKIQVSQDGKSWTDVVTVGDGVENAVHDDSLTDGWTHDSKMPGNRYIEGELASPVKANYLRVLFTADYNARFVGFTELVINDGEFVKPVNNPTVEGTGAESRDNLKTNLVDGKVLTSYKASEDKGELVYHLSENTGVNHIRLISNLPAGTKARVQVRTAAQERDQTWQDLGAVTSSFQTFVVKTENPQVLDVKLSWEGGKAEFYELTTYNQALTAEELAEPKPEQPGDPGKPSVPAKPGEAAQPKLNRTEAIAQIEAATKAKEAELGNNASITAELEEGLAFTKGLIQTAPDQASIDEFVAGYLESLKDYKPTPAKPEQPGETTEPSKPGATDKPVDKPTEPAKPGDTDKSVDKPTEPTQPTQPGDIDKPADKPGDTAKPTDQAQTGQTNNQGSTTNPSNITPAPTTPEKSPESGLPADYNNKYHLNYDKPAATTYDGWEKQALPVGNGEMGAKVFGLVGAEKIQYNEKTLWSGGPRPDSTDYNGGNYKDRYKVMADIRKALEAGNVAEAKKLAERNLIGPSDAQYGRYLSFGDIHLDFTNQSKELSSVTDYHRGLDISTAITSTSYTQDGTNFTRETFSSFPDDVTVTHLTQKGDKKLDFTLGMDLTRDLIDGGKYKTEKSDFKDGTVTASTDGILLKGTVKDNGLNFASYLGLKTDGTVTLEGDKIKVTGASQVTLYLSAKTDFAQNPKTNYRKEIDVEKAVKDTVSKAKAKDYQALKDSHIKDYQALFNRVKLNLGGKTATTTTKEQLTGYQPEQGQSLEELFFQYGRYLLITSSRDKQDALPANLQGVWNGVDNPPWNADYHLNVNLQMNYWPVYSTNLAENAKPLINYIDDMRYFGRIAAKEYAGIESKDGQENGWLVHTQATPFGWTTPGWNYYWGWSPAANAWIMQNVYDHYKFTHDEEYLKDKIYPMLKETAKFWNSFLHYDKASDRWVSSPSYSPEHGTITIGNTFDQSLVWQLFHDYMEAANHLNVDQDFVKEVQAKFEKLKPLHINKAGQIKEWYEEDTPVFTGEGVQKGHRHASHLVGLFPGTLFSKDNPEYLEAARASLNDRGDGGTGWSKANKINLWARLLDGNRAHRLLAEQLRSSTLENLWDTHAPFQIDGNFGATSGMTEMLLQSHTGYVAPLPALPDAWKDGEVSGLVARGNFETSMKWADKNLEKLSFTSNSGGDLVVDYPNIERTMVKVNGKEVKPSLVKGNRIQIATQKGDVVTFENFTGRVTTLTAERKNSVTAALNFNAVKGVTHYIIERTASADEGQAPAVRRFVTNDTNFIDRSVDSAHTYTYKVQAILGNVETPVSDPAGIDVLSYVFDDRDERIQYGSAYGNWPDSSLYGGTEKFADITNSNVSEAAATATLSFTGVGIEVYGLKSERLGLAKVTIDGKPMADMDFYDTSSQKGVLIGRYAGLSDGPHTMTITVKKENKGRSNERSKISLDYFKVLQGASGAIEKIDDRDSRIQYGAAFGDWADAELYGGTEKYADINNHSNPAPGEATATIPFAGTGIRVYGLKTAELGKALVTIDGKEMPTLDFHTDGATQKGALIGEFTGLTDGNHILTLTVDPASPQGKKKISLDSFEILKAPAVALDSPSLAPITAEDKEVVVTLPTSNWDALALKVPGVKEPLILTKQDDTHVRLGEEQVLDVVENVVRVPLPEMTNLSAGGAIEAYSVLGKTVTSPVVTVFAQPSKATEEETQPTETVKPGGGTDQAEPTSPADPGMPSDSAKPGETDKPGDPVQPGETDKSVETEKPGNQGKPVDPAKPGETDKPGDQGKPVDPAKPGDTDKPGDQGKPVDPAKPGETNKPDDQGKPSDPAKPGDTDKPVDKPTEPTQPGDTAKPADKPGDTSRPTDQAQIGQTSNQATTPGHTTQTPAPTDIKTLFDRSTGLAVFGRLADLAEVDHLEVQKVGDQSLAGKNYDAFDIKLKGKNGHEVQPKGAVIVSLPVKPGAEVDKVYYVTPSKELEAIKFDRKGDRVEFATTHFSIYAVVYKQPTPAMESMSGETEETVQALSTKSDETSKPAVKGAEDKATLPNTGDSSNAHLIFLASLSLALSALFFVKGKKN